VYRDRTVFHVHV